MKSTINMKAPTKLELSLLEFLDRESFGMFALEALNSYGDTCLNSTVSTLSNIHSIEFDRIVQLHQSQRGPIVRFTRYTIKNDEERNKAITLLENLREKRGANLIHPC
jgi:hypothetical protein